MVWMKGYLALGSPILSFHEPTNGQPKYECGGQRRDWLFLNEPLEHTHGPLFVFFDCDGVVAGDIGTVLDGSNH
ncbi:hypothetical protein [Rhodopirellula sallentina]|uniref:hypothetical protein n=1 Tax=Rhodopirellula sallentina TaxID=1263869 RepID=UPI00034A0344|nr:hypothetical protein [Rhodopirellula sallentina]